MAAFEASQTQGRRPVQFYITARARHSQIDVPIGRRQHRIGLFRPFDDADIVAVEVFAEAGVEEFLGAAHAVQVEVDDVDGASVQLHAVRLLTLPTWPAACSSARVRAVLPAPRSPCRWIARPGASTRASAAPRAAVPASSWRWALKCGMG